MKKLSRQDLWPLAEYANIRDDYRKGILEYKKHRRIEVGDRVTLVFENRKTMKWQVMEMIRAEHMTSEEAIEGELEVYNELVPEAGELVATMFIAFSESARVRAEMPDFLGLDEAVWLVVDGREIHGEPEAGRSEAERISSVQYVRFHLDAAAREALSRPGAPTRLEVRHESHGGSVAVPEEMRRSLAEDLA